jgi:hypothetical protein
MPAVRMTLERLKVGRLVGVLAWAAAAAGVLAGFSDPGAPGARGAPGVAVRAGAKLEPARSKVWVRFADKGFETAAEEAAAVGELAGTANARQVQRRKLRRTEAGLFDARDLNGRGR